MFFVSPSLLPYSLKMGEENVVYAAELKKFTVNENSFSTAQDIPVVTEDSRYQLMAANLSVKLQLPSGEIKTLSYKADYKMTGYEDFFTLLAANFPVDGTYIIMVSADGYASSNIPVTIGSTQPSVDKSRLEAKLSEAENAVKNGSNLTEKSKKNLQVIISASKTVLDNQNATQTEIDNAEDALKEGILKLVNLTSIDVISSPTANTGIKDEYIIGDSVSYMVLAAKLNYSDGTHETVKYQNFDDYGLQVSPPYGTVLDTLGENKIVVSKNNLSGEKKFKVIGKNFSGADCIIDLNEPISFFAAADDRSYDLRINDFQVSLTTPDNQTRTLERTTNSNAPKDFKLSALSNEIKLSKELFNQSGVYTIRATANTYLPFEMKITVRSDNKEGKVTVKYVDDKGKEISDAQTLTGKVGDLYDATAAEYKKEIAGYSLVESQLPANGTGRFSEEVQTVIYVYEKNKGSEGTVSNHNSDNGINNNSNNGNNNGTNIGIGNNSDNETNNGSNNETNNNFNHSSSNVSNKGSNKGSNTANKNTAKTSARVLPKTGESSSWRISLMGICLLVVAEFSKYVYNRKIR